MGGEKSDKMPTTGPRLPGKRVDNMAVYSGGRMLQIPSPICMASAEESEVRSHKRKTAARRLGEVAERAS